MTEGRIGHRMRRIARRAEMIFSRYRNPIQPVEFRLALDRVTAGGADILLVHSSLSACGRYVAGANDVIAALAESCNTLAMPTHSYCYPPAPDVLAPLFDARNTSSKVGAITERFWRQPGVERSIHSTHSLAVSGRDARSWCAGHYLHDSPCGEGTPYERLVHSRASVLMLGVTFNAYTFFHTAEFSAASPFAAEMGVRDSLRFLDEGGRTRARISRRQGRSPTRFAEAGLFLERIGLVRREPLGMGFLLFVPDSAKVHDLLLNRLKRCPDFLRDSCKTELA